MEAVAAPSSKTDTLLSTYSVRNNHNNSGSKPPLPLRTPKQHALVILEETQISKANRLPRANVNPRRSRRKNTKKSGGGGGGGGGSGSSTSLVNRLLFMHVSSGHMDIARQLFDRMTHKNFISWATLIVGYASVARYDEAIGLFVKMQDRFNMLETPSWIVVCVPEACISTTNMELGKQIHARLHKFGIANHDLFLTSSLIEFYGKLGCREGSDFVFHQLSRHNTMTWTARIIGSCREEHFHDVFSYFKEMGSAGIKKSTFTFSSVLRACGGIQDDGKSGRQVHANAVKLGLDKDSFVQCGLVDMYGRNGLLRDARLMFEKVDDKRNVAYWNAMMGGYMRNGVYIEAIKLLYQMKAAGVKPPESLLNEVRIACGNDSRDVNGHETL